MADPWNARVLARRYELGEVIGEGGMGRVHDAFDTRLQRPVAIKVLRPDVGRDPEQRARFRREASTAAQINHPHVVVVYDVGDDDDADDELFIVMERLPGRTLADEFADGRVDPDRVRTLAVELLGALGAAHAAGVLHRDVKPGNILFTAAGSAKLGDFGIAKLRDTSDLTSPDLLVGTAAYLPPERLLGRPATPAGDQYALALVLYEALAGRPAFRGDGALAVAHAVTTADPPPIAELRPDVDADLARAITRAMRRDPADRFPSVEAMAAALAGPTGGEVTAAMPVLAEAAIAPTTVLATSGGTTVPMAMPPSATPMPPGRRRLSPALIASVVALAVAGLAIMAVGLGDDAAPAAPTSTTSTAPTTSPTTSPTTIDSTTTTSTATTPPAPAPTSTKAPAKGKGRDKDDD